MTFNIMIKSNKKIFKPDYLEKKQIFLHFIKQSLKIKV